MKRNRSMAVVVRNHKLLMEKLFYYNRTFFSLPGGGIENNETPEQAAIRELKEECCVDGKIIRKLATLYRAEGGVENVFLVEIPEDQEPSLGFDPEEAGAHEEQRGLKSVLWKGLDELSEKDRSFMWSYGLLGVEEFFNEAVSWGDEISYPKKS